MNTQIFASLARYVLVALLVFFGLALLILGSPKSRGQQPQQEIKRNASLGNTATRMVIASTGRTSIIIPVSTTLRRVERNAGSNVYAKWEPFPPLTHVHHVAS